VRFACAVVEVFGAEYLRETNVQDTWKLLAIGKERGFLGMLNSINCMHCNGRTAPKGLCGMYQGHTKEATIILEEVHHMNCGFGMLSLDCLILTTTSMYFSDNLCSGDFVMGNRRCAT
jgi:hypothetical protein